MTHGELIPPPTHVWGLYNSYHPLLPSVTTGHCAIRLFSCVTMSNVTLSTKLRENFEVDAHVHPNPAA